MFEIGWSELLLIGIVALIVIGPKELPAVLRTLGQWMTKLRRMASDFQSQFQEAMREAEMADLKKQVDEITGEAQSYTNFDPAAEVHRELETTQQQIQNAFQTEPSSNIEKPTTEESGRPATMPNAGEPSLSTSSDPAVAAPSVSPPSAPAPEGAPADAVDQP